MFGSLDTTPKKTLVRLHSLDKINSEDHVKALVYLANL